MAGLIAELGAQPELVTVSTAGDRDRTTPLTQIGGTGIFVKALEAELIAGRVDVAVHSLKDVPTAPTPGLTLAAFLTRADARDALLGRDHLRLGELPAGSRVGTSSSRRLALLRAVRPDLEVVPLRGNVDSRVRRVGAGLDAVVLAAAGLERLGLAHRLSQRLDPAVFVPAPGQGILAVQVRTDAAALRRLLGRLDVRASRVAAAAERACLASFGGGCTVPVGAHAEVLDGGMLRLTAFAAAESGEAHRLRLMGPAQAPARLGRQAGALFHSRLSGLSGDGANGDGL